jgi:endonuclease YncB( thermonuclease family)
MAERQYKYWTEKDEVGAEASYRAFTEKRDCTLLYVDLKDNTYNISVEDAQGGGYQATLSIKKGATGVNKDFMTVCEIMSPILNSKQSGSGIIISGTYNEVQLEVKLALGGTEWKTVKFTWSSLTVSSGAVSTAKTVYKNATEYVIGPEKCLITELLIGREHGHQIRIQRPDLSYTTAYNMTDSAVQQDVKNMVDTLIKNTSGNIKDFGYMVVYEKRTDNLKPKKRTAEYLTTDTETMKKISYDIERRSGDALSAMTDKEWKSSLESDFTTATADFYHDYYPTLDAEGSTWMRGTVTNIIDGDTIEIKLIDSKDVKQTITGGGTIDLEVGQTYKVRFVGINTPETKKTGEAEDTYQSEDRNIRWLSDHNLPDDAAGENIQMAYNIAKDGKVFLKELLLNKEVIIDVDTANNGYGVGMDSGYNRFVGVVHIPIDFENHQDSINVNRTMLSSMSKSHSDYSLADVDYYLYNGVLNSKFPVIGWMIQDKDIVSPERYASDQELTDLFEKFEKGGFIDIHGKIWYNKNNSGTQLATEDIAKLGIDDLCDSDNNTYQSSLEYRANINPLISEDDDREWNPYDDMPTDFHVKIGDVTLVVPPLSINIMHTSKNEKIQTLRNRNAIQIQSGYSDYIVTMELFFHDIDSINGYEIANPFKNKSPKGNITKATLKQLQDLWPEPYHINGLRALLAQFAKAPFVPIYNEFLEKTYGIYSVGLESIQVGTVPGFPNTLAVTLTMVNFDHRAYMPDVLDLGEVIDWPIFRWYLQDALQPRIVDKQAYNAQGNLENVKVLDPHHIYFEEIKDQFNDGVSFEIANEDILRMKLTAIKKLRSMISPSDFKEQNNSTDTTIGKFDYDGRSIGYAIDQWNKFVTWKKTHTAKTDPMFYNTDGIFDGGVNANTSIKTYNIFDSAISKKISNDTGDDKYANINELFSAVYGDDWYKSGRKTGWEKPGERGAYFIMNGCTTANNSYEGTTTNWTMPAEDYPGYNSSGGWIVVPIFAEINKNLVQSNNIRHFNTGDHTIAMIDPNDTVLLNVLLKNSKEGGQDSYDAYRDETNRLSAIADISEDDVPMIPISIDGLHIKAINASISNTFSKLQLQEHGASTLQYLGGQEMHFTINAQTTSRDCIYQLKSMVEESQRLAREYRIAINSGFLNINNSLVNFLGVRSILIEQLVVATVPGTPELIDITISCTSFDKSQRERESIKQIQLRDPNSSNEQYTMEQFEKYFSKNSGNEQQQMVIFDFKLRQQELYPDLDLPTWTEFEMAIPYLNCGVSSLAELDKRISDITGNLPPDRAKYVDPDFYIHCGWTNRMLLNQALLDEDARTLLMHDSGGVRSVETVPGVDLTEIVDPSITVNNRFWVEDNALREQLKEDLGELIDNKDLEERYKVQIKNAITGVSTVIKSDASPEQSKDGDLPYVNKNILDAYYFNANNAEDREKFVFKYLHTVPTAGEVVGWQLADQGPYSDVGPQYRAKLSSIEKQLERPEEYFKNPDKDEVMREIEYLVDLFFEFPDTNDSDSGSSNNYVYGNDYTISVPRITKTKIINVIKAIIDHESSWRQFYKDKKTIGGVYYDQPMPLFPLKDGDLWKTSGGWIACGLMQMAVGTAGNVRNLSEARRAVWDWKFNLKIGMTRFAEMYNTQANKGSAEAKALPLDYAIIKYNAQGNKDLTCGYYKAVKDIFVSKYSQSSQQNADNETSRNAEYSYEENMTNIDTLTLYTNRSSIDVWNESGEPAKGSKAATYGLKGYSKTYPEFFKYVSDNGDDGKSIDLKAMNYIDAVHTRMGNTNNSGFLNEMLYVVDLILVKIDDVIKNGGTFDHKNDVIDIQSEVNGSTVSHTITIVQNEGGMVYAANDVINYNELLGASFYPSVNTELIKALRGSFTDSIEFDMRGRLVRAFPTFQMFIVDEGRWTLWYKLWDNLYGYNAIQSIDLIKDREMVADTLIMQMTNVYSNLTTKESKYEDTYDSFTIVDLFTGSPEDKAKVWDTMWNKADQSILDARSEQLDTMMLKPGARIHLRMGYGSNADNMPIAFNGTITEMDAQEIVTVIAQGDGIELTNKINAKKNETNSNFFDLQITEPRQLICSLMSSKGSWLKDTINSISGGWFFRGNPLGITHFGGDAIIPPALKKVPIFQTSEDNWGEIGFNIYSAGGKETFSRWICYGKADKLANEANKITWGQIPADVQMGDKAPDEPNIKVYLYDKTLWDIVNILSMAVPDYICAVHPFELRSTLFYGKPMWGLAYKYDYLFRINPNTGNLQRVVTNEFRKPYSQFHIFNGFSDIISNKIKATEAGMYTNVIVAYGGSASKVTPIIQADSDIYPENQKTAIIQADIATDERFGIGTGILSTNFWTSEAYAQAVGSSALKNYMAHMYDGELIILGYPSIKPHDKFYLEDNYGDMQGTAGVRRVVHHMSLETGFVTSITPDCVAVVDDMQQLSLLTWLVGLAGDVVAGTLIKVAAIRTLNKLFRGLVGRSWRSWRRDSKEVGTVLGGIIAQLIDPTTQSSINLTDEMMDALRSGRKFTNVKKAIQNSKTSSKVINGLKKFFTSIDDIADGIDAVDDAGQAFKKVGKAAKAMRMIKGIASVADVALGATGAIIIDVGITIVTDGLVEMYRRYRHNRQAVVLMPLKYRGKEFVAGIKGHRGLIYGEPGGRFDKWFEENSFIQMIDGFVFEDGKNPSLRNKMATPDEFLGIES